jgi:hypothetical protein
LFSLILFYTNDVNILKPSLLKCVPVWSFGILVIRNGSTLYVAGQHPFILENHVVIEKYPGLKHLASLTDHTSGVHYMAVSPDGK